MYMYMYNTQHTSMYMFLYRCTYIHTYIHLRYSINIHDMYLYIGRTCSCTGVHTYRILYYKYKYE